MKAKDYLQKIRTMSAALNADLEELEQLNALATKTTSVLGDERVQSSGSQQKLEDYAVKMADLKDQITRDIVVFLDYKKEARQLIKAGCEAECITLLSKRYFKGMKWEEIAVEMGFTYQWVSDGLHKRALEQLQKVLDEENSKKLKQLIIIDRS